MWKRAVRVPLQAGLLLGVLGALALPSKAQQDAMKICGAEWQKVKEKNKGEAPKGLSWQKFLGDCRKRHGGRAKATAAKAKPRKAAPKTKSAASGESMMAACGAEWRALKGKSKVPAGMTWTKYLSECSERYAGKFKPTPAQLAMYKRIKKCGAEWHTAKEKGRLKKGITWPKFWSDCNARAKRRGN